MIFGFSFEIARSPKTKDVLRALEQVMEQQQEVLKAWAQPPTLIQPPEPAPNAFPVTKILVMDADELEALKRRSAGAKKAAATRKKNKKAALAASTTTTTFKP